MRIERCKLTAVISIAVALLVLITAALSGGFAYANENVVIPESGVTYTLTYPDGTVVTKTPEGDTLTYNDVTEAQKTENWKLLGSGYKSDANGEVSLPAAWKSGTIRIVETKVPAGYIQGSEKEKTADLKDGSTEFVNPKKKTTPDAKYYKITYKLNGGVYAGSPDDIVEIYEDGTVIDIHEAPTWDGHTFDYWKGSEYQPGDKYTVTEDHTFIAQWKQPNVPITTTTIETGGPKTGDNSNVLSWMLLLVASTISLFILNAIKLAKASNSDGIIVTKHTNKLLLVLIVVSAIALVATTVSAASGFTINKVDDNGNPVEGAVFDVYGRPEVTWESIPEESPQTIDISGVKTWDDADNQDEARPESITVRLLADGVEVDSKEVSAADDWKYEFKDLPKNENEKDIIYTITEDAVADYTTEISGFDITNTYTPGKTSVTVEKVWNDSDNQDGIRPQSVVVKLLANGIEKDRATITAAENWRHEFTNLKEKFLGIKIKYTVEEVKTDVITGTDDRGTYSTNVTGDASKGFTIINTHTPEKTSISGGKTWDDANNQDGKRPTSITIRLHADGVETESKTVRASDDWKWQFTDLPLNKDGNRIVYTITEDVVSNYTHEISGYDVKNIYTPGKISIDVEKIWDDANNQDGKRPASVTVKLIADGNETGQSITLNEANNWECTFSNLDEFNDGTKIDYTVEEDAVGGYTTSIAREATIGYAITNKYTPETTSVSGSKTWNDDNNRDGKRPESITIRLHADGVEKESKIVRDSDDWKWTFDNLPKYKNGGNEIVYTVTEDAVEGYTPAQSGYNFTNSYTPGKTSVTVEKAWDDADNQDGIRPDSVTVKLLADNVDTGKTLTLNSGNQWKGTFTNLDEYKEGSEGVKVDYSVQELSTDVITGTDGPGTYAITVTGRASTVFTITNTHTPEKVSIDGTKVWGDYPRDSVNPNDIAEFTVKLQKSLDGTSWTDVSGYEQTVLSGTVMPPPDPSNPAPLTTNEWKFENLPKYENGKEIQYRCIENPVPENFEASIGTVDANGNCTITNTYVPPVYTLIYNPNGGQIDTAKSRVEEEDAADSHIFDIETNANLGLTHSNPNRVFMGWADTADAAEPKYSSDGKGLKDGGDGTAVEIDDLAKNVTLYAPNREKTLYAVWGTEYSLSFDPNNDYLGGQWKDGIIPDDLVTMKAFSTEESYQFRIPVQNTENTPVRENEQKWNWKWWGIRYNATGPATEKNPHWLYDQPITLYADGDIANGKPEAKQTLYAFYQPSNGATVVFDKNTNETVTSIPRNFGTSETNEIVSFNIGSQVPERTNYKFIGWSTDKDRKAKDFDSSSKTDFDPGNQFSFNQIEEAYRTLYAVWKPYNQYRIHFVYNEEVSKMYEDGVYRIVNGGFLHHYYGVSSYGQYVVDGVTKTSQYMIKSGYTLDNEYTWTKQYWSGVGVHARHVTTETMEYDFLGWSTDPNDDTPEYTVDTEGYIDMDIKQVEDEDSTDGIHNLVLYAVWRKTPKHTFRLLFMCTDSYNRYDTVVNRSTGRTDSLSVESPLYSYMTKSDGSPIVALPGSSQYANVGFINKAVPLSETEYRVSKDDLNRIGPKATKASTSTYDVKLIGWSYEPWKRSNPDIPVDEDGYFLDDIVLEEPKVSPDECSGEIHNLLLWPVWKYSAKHTYNVYFSVDTGVEVANRIHFYNTTANEWQVSERDYTQYRHNAQTDEWSTYSNIGFWVRHLKATGYGGYGRSVHSGSKFIHYYSGVVPASNHTPPWNDAFWKSQRLYAERDNTATVKYNFVGWRRADTNQVIPVDDEGYLTEPITFNEDDDVFGYCEGKEEGTSHDVILFPVWERIPLNTWTIVFATNMPGGYNVGLDDEGNRKTTSSIYGYSGGYYTQTVNSANDTVSNIFTVNGGWAPTSTYSSGPHAIDSEFGRQYVWKKEFWQTHGEAAVTPNSRTARYKFLGWSYGEKVDGPNGSKVMNSRNPGTLTAADVDIHVDENGLINEDIIIKDPLMDTTEGHIFHKVLYGVWEVTPIHSFHLHFDKNFTYEHSNYEVGVHFQEEADGQWLYAPQMHVRTTADYNTIQYDVADKDHYTWEADGFWDTHGCYATRPDRMRDSEYYTYEFLGWSDAKDASGNALNPATLTEADVDYHMTADGKHIAEDITIRDEDNCEGGEHHLTLYAVWKPIPRTRSYTINYDVNGGTGTFNSETKTELYNDTAWAETSPDFDIPATRPTKDNFAFVGWAQTEDATFGEFGHQYGDNAELRNITSKLKPTINYTFDDHKTGDLTASKTLYAVWWYEYDISFNANAPEASGGPAVQHIYRISDHAIIRAFGEDDNDPLPSPVRPGYKFLGWSRNATDTEPEFSTVSGYPSELEIAGDPSGKKSVTLYAIWEPDN